MSRLHDLERRQWLPLMCKAFVHTAELVNYGQQSWQRSTGGLRYVLGPMAASYTNQFNTRHPRKAHIRLMGQ